MLIRWSDWRLSLSLLLCLSLNPNVSQAARNGGGALVVHTNDAIAYSPGMNYCDSLVIGISDCASAVTRTDKDEDTPAIVWVLAAFPADSNPAVTAV